MVYTAGRDSLIKSFDSKLVEIAKKDLIMPKGTLVKSLTLFPDNKMAVSSGTDHIVRIWNLPEKNRIATLNGHCDIIVHHFLDHATDRLYTASLDSTLRVWDIKIKKCINVIFVRPFLSFFS
jgi:WD40 repeat protein